MGKLYVGVNNIARSANKIYVGVNGIARQVKKIYVGDPNGIAREVFSDFDPLIVASVTVENTVSGNHGTQYVNAVTISKTRLEEALANGYTGIAGHYSVRNRNTYYAETGIYLQFRSNNGTYSKKITDTIKHTQSSSFTTDTGDFSVLELLAMINNINAGGELKLDTASISTNNNATQYATWTLTNVRFV